MLGPLARRSRGFEAIPGHAADQQQDRDQHGEDEKVGSSDRMPRHRHDIRIASILIALPSCSALLT
jgi:hypothetical protein